MRIHNATWLAICLSCVLSISAITRDRQKELKEEIRELYRHGYEGYMKYAWPADELRPLTCGPLLRDPNPNNYGQNDVHGNVSMTLLDNLSALPLILPERFPDALEKVTTTISFDQNVKIQVFELTIRALGGLLSTWQYLDNLPPSIQEQQALLGVKSLDKDLKGYQPKILDMALDLGKRFLPAFETATGIPYSRINLRHGVEKGESQETSGAGSLILEFALLSRLTGDERFELLAHKAYLAIWNRRSNHDLIGNTIGAIHGQWLVPGMSGVGAGIDSFFEYGIKAAILLNDDVYMDVFYDSYAAIQTHIRSADGFIYRPVQIRSLQLANPSTIDSLAAFLPGTQILAGDIESAIKHHLVYWNLWRKYSAMPESWDWEERKVVWAGWPGRPEFIEATYYLYKATKDPFYLKVGERFLNDMKRRVKTSCGFATMHDVDSGVLEDRMESFVLSETLKYLYLLFHDSSPSKLSNKVFTTEGHPLSLAHKFQRRPPSTRKTLHRGENLQCPVYKPPNLNGLIVGIEQRRDYEYARSLVFGFKGHGVLAERGNVHWRSYGYCEVPNVPRHSVMVSLSPLDNPDPGNVPIDPSPSSSKVYQDVKTGNYIVKDVSGLSLNLRWRLDNTGYDVATIGPHRIRTGQGVMVNDPKMDGYLPVPSTRSESHTMSELVLRFSSSEKGKEDYQVFLHAIAATATFGRDFGVDHKDGWTFDRGVRLNVPHKSGRDIHGCREYQEDKENTIVLVKRGDCTFTEKLQYASKARAVGVIVFDNDDYPRFDSRGDTNQVLIRPEGSADHTRAGLGDDEIGMVFTTSRVGEILLETLESKSVSVEMLSSDLFSDHHGDSPPAGSSRERMKSGMGEGKGVRREGKLALGPWEIMNLRIVGG